MAVKPVTLTVDTSSNPLTANQGVGPSIIDSLLARDTGKSVDQPVVQQKQALAADFINQAVSLGLDPVKTSKAFESGDQSQIDQIMTTIRNHTGESQGPVAAVDPNQDIVVTAPKPDGPTTKTIGEMVREPSGNSPVSNPFAVGKNIRDQAAATADVIDSAIGVNKQLVEASHNLARTRNEVLPEVFKRKDEINNTQVQEENVFRNRIKPAIDKKAQIDDRIIQLETESKGSIFKQLLHGIKGLVDPNYDLESLKQKSDALGGAVASVAQSYLVGVNERSQEYAHLDQIAANKIAPAELDVENAGQNIRATTSLLQATQAGFNFLNDQVQANTAVAAAQMQATGKFLAEQTDAQISQLVGQARAHGGVLDVGGVKITAGQLEEQSQKRRQQNMALESASLALKSQNLQLHEQQINHALGLMTLEQLTAVRANGYVANGMKVPPLAVDQQINALALSRQQRAIQDASQSDVGIVNQQSRQFLDEYNTLVKKTNATLGSVSPLRPLVQDIHNTIGRVQQLWATAEKNGTTAETAPIISKIIEESKAKLDAARGGLALQMADGDKKGASYMLRFLQGDAFTAADAYEFSRWADSRGDLPSTMRMNQPAMLMLQNYKEAKAAVDHDIKAKGISLNPAQRELRIQREFAARGSRAITDFSANDVTKNLPDIARKLDHPFAGVTTAQFAQAQAAGDIAGLRQFAESMGLPTNDLTLARQVWLYRPGQPEPTPGVAGFKRRQTPQITAAANAAGQVGILNALDALPVASQMKMRPSDAYIDLLHDPRLQSQLGGIEAHGANLSAGGAMANALSRGGLSLTIAGQAQSLARAQQERIAAITAGSFNAHNRYTTDGVYKLRAVLGQIPDLNPQEEKALADAVERIAVNQQTPSYYTAGVEQKSPAPSFSSVVNIIHGQKFQDPNLERLRKLVAPQLNKQSEMLDRAVDRLSQGN